MAATVPKLLVVGGNGFLGGYDPVYSAANPDDHRLSGVQSRHRQRLAGVEREVGPICFYSRLLSGGQGLGLTDGRSQSGTPYKTPAGHTPTWSTKVDWHAGSAFDPSSYSSLVSSSSAVVHTLGVLLEDQGYKSSVRGGDVFGLGKALLGGLTGSQGNPLKTKEAKRMGYEGMNRDSGQS